MAVLRVVGFDPSLRHWGVASGVFDTRSKQLEVDYVEVVEPIVPTDKQVRQNSKDLAAAHQLAEAALRVTHGANAVFVEVPHGSQSARAMAGYGVCLGVLASLRAQNIPFFEVSERQVKQASVGNRNASKQAVIDWAVAQWPQAPWATYKRNGEELLSASKVEHQADAAATLYTGVNLPEFTQLIQLTHTFTNKETV